MFYKVSTADFDPREDGLGPLSDLNIIDLNDLGVHLGELVTPKLPLPSF